MICGKFIPCDITPAMEFKNTPPVVSIFNTGRPKTGDINPNSQRVIRLKRNKDAEKLVLTHFDLIHGILTADFGKLKHVVAELEKVTKVPQNSHRLILKYYKVKHEAMLGGAS